MKETILVSWSSGKDSALALYHLRQDPRYEIRGLLTTLTEGYDRVSMHGVRRTLLEAQADALGLPLEVVYIPKDASQEAYEERMGQALRRHRDAGVSGVAFGDIFLEDLRAYREERLASLQLRSVFPLWQRPTAALATECVRAGFRAITTCVDTRVLGGEFAGQEFGQEFLDGLPASIDPCGENGEFHTFAYDGPIFARKISHTLGEKVLRDERFYFCDLLPGDK